MKLSIYDFDGTYVHVQTLPKLYKLWKELDINESSRRPIWRKIMVRYVFHKLHLFGWDKRKFNPYTMEQTADLFRSVDRPTLDLFLAEHYQRLVPMISDTIRTQLQKDKEEGYHTVLLSGNLDIILNHFKEEGFDSILGTTSERDGTLLSSREVDIIIQKGKQEAILVQFPDADLSASKAYADSWYDIPILELVGYPTVVNPDDRLRDYAIKHNWPILITTQ